MIGPVYIRLAREKTPIITNEETPFEIGKSQVFFKPESLEAKAGIIVCGALVYNAIKVAKELENEGIGVSVLNLPTIKPLDEEGIVHFVEESGGKLVTVEEHQIRGGMGSAVAELLAKKHPAPIEFIGVDDKFGQSGTPDELIEHYGMGIGAIKAAVLRVLQR
jgi:transketolase